jgi:hypothetical protein
MNADGGGGSAGTNNGAAGTAGGGAAGAAGTNADGGGGSAGATNDGAAGTADAPTSDGGPDGNTSPAGAPLKVCASNPDCPVGSSCVGGTSTRTYGHCIPDGTSGGGLCRSTGTVCDTGLACDLLAGSQFTAIYERCAPAVADGAACGLNAACQDAPCKGAGATVSGTCPTPGTVNNPCRATAPRCDAGLGCTATTNGTACVTLTATTACSTTAGCPDGTDCNTALAMCIAPGALNGNCRAADPACDASLVCQNGRCFALAAVGGFCATNAVCPAGTKCIGNQCMQGGAYLGPCASDGSCNTGLTCAGDGTCRYAVFADGATCASTSSCKAGSSCTLYTPTHVCAPVGTVGTTCYMAASDAHACATGLFCSELGSCQDPATAVAVAGACAYPMFCAPGSTCVTARNATSGICAVTGGAGGPCRPAAQGTTPCDAGLGCYTFTPQVNAPSTTCQPETLTAGMACNSLSQTAHCVPGTTCRNNVCVAPGKLGGTCRANDPTGGCDTLLACSASGCVSGLADGATCSPTTDPRCALPDICVTVGAASTCALAGYSEEAVATLPFIDACGPGIHVPLVAASTFLNPRVNGHPATALNLPFPFRFWGSDQTLAWPSSRGFLKLGSDAPSDIGVGNGYLPTDTFGPLIAPFWDDIQMGDAPASDICYAVTGTAPARKFVVEWAHAHRYGVPGSDLDFEIVINETTRVIELAYETLAPATGADASWSDGSRASIGLQSGYDSVAIRHAGAVVAGGGLRYTPH